MHYYSECTTTVYFYSVLLQCTTTVCMVLVYVMKMPRSVGLVLVCCVLLASFLAGFLGCKECTGIVSYLCAVGLVLGEIRNAALYH